MSNPTAEDWGANLRAAREAKGWSQLRLAEVSGVGQASISTAERGASRPDHDTQVALAKALERPVTELFPRDEGEIELLARCSGVH
jgi:transcriptional regulator with XRE-family HTH domain